MSRINAKVVSYPHTYLFKASWRATALRFEVSGRDEAHALKRAENQVLRMMGGMSCQGIELVKQLT